MVERYGRIKGMLDSNQAIEELIMRK
jgi:hypothetical protein